MKKIVVGISGASGVVIGDRLIHTLLDLGHEVHTVISTYALMVYREEMDVQLGQNFSQVEKNFKLRFKASKRLVLYPPENLAARISSGSSKMDAMVIAPCSMSTAAAIAHGLTTNLIHRAASVAIKERRPLVVVPRESPMSTIHLKNLLTLSEVGAFVVPATTAFYHRPKNVGEMVDFTVGRVLDLLRIEHHLFKRWKENIDE